MFLVLATFVAMASAAPHELPEAYFSRSSFKQYTSAVLPDIHNLGATMNNYNIIYNSAPWTITSTGKLYVMLMPMSGFQKGDIDVLGSRGLLAMRAIHTENGIVKKSEVSLNFLPLRVNPAGWWTYNDDVLKIMLPIDGMENDVGATRDFGASDITQIVLYSNM